MIQSAMHNGPEAYPDDALRGMLVMALDEEVALLERLRDIFARQKEALASGDPHALDDGVFAATRVMRTMEEARRRRTSLTTRLIGGELDFDEWDVVLTGPENRPVRHGQERVRQAAARLREEVSMLRQILRSALADNRRYLEVLLGSGSGAPAPGVAAGAAAYGAAGSYHTGDSGDDVTAGAVLNRTL